MVYTSINNDKIKEIKKLQSKKYRDELGVFFIESEHLVEEAYKQGLLKLLIVEENYDYQLDIDTIKVSKNIISYLSELESPKKVMGIVNKIPSKEIGKKVLALDNIQDPGNMGTIIRSAVAFNIDTILISKDSVDIYNSKVIRSTQGMIFGINIIICDLEKKLIELKNNNYTLYGTKVDGGESIKDIEVSDKFVIIMGNEGQGVKDSIFDLCDKYLYIKMNDKCESLNVGVATSIILYELDK